jgi:hypothetical protein
MAKASKRYQKSAENTPYDHFGSFNPLRTTAANSESPPAVQPLLVLIVSAQTLAVAF